jgi:hypothetical protein
MSYGRTLRFQYHIPSYMFIIGRIALSLLRFDRFSRVRLPVTPIGVVSAGSLVLNLFPGSAQSGGADFFTYKGTLYTLVKSGGTYVAVQAPSERSNCIASPGSQC